MPKLAVSEIRLPGITSSDDSLSARRIRSATSAAESTSVSGKRTANSSPPSRPATSTFRTWARKRSPNVCSARSPARWPCSSLTPLEVVQIREHERKRGFEQARPLELVLERLQEAAAVDEAGQFVGGRLPLDALVQPRVLEGDACLRREPLRERGRLLAETAPGWIEEQRRPAAGFVVAGQVELEGLSLPHLSEPADLLAVLDEQAAARAGRLGHDLQDQRQEGPRVMRRRESVPYECERLARVALRAVRPAPVDVRLRRRGRAPRRAQHRDEERRGEHGRGDGSSHQRWPVVPRERNSRIYMPQVAAIVAFTATSWWRDRQA